jgi:putative FmdB family regulatory protein
LPTYQYACTACGHQLEAVQSFTDEPLNECPACEGRLRKLFNSVGIVFKGSGFYRTDSRSSADKSGSDSSSSDSSKTPSSTPASSDKSASSTSTSSSDKSSASTSSSSSSSSAKPAAATTS